MPEPQWHSQTRFSEAESAAGEILLKYVKITLIINFHLTIIQQHNQLNHSPEQCCFQGSAMW
jgi:hypothetical protein